MFFSFLDFQVDLLKGQKSDKVDVTLLPEELEAMENVLQARYEFLFIISISDLVGYFFVEMISYLCWIYAGTRKLGRKRSCVVSEKISVTWLQRCVN